jgi:CO/xanthine dehydrogenase Mo-binding subunit
MKPGLYLPLVNDAAGVYRTPNVRINCHMVYTNTVPGGHFRGPGQAQGVFAAESMVDIVARDLGVDPLEYRLRHVVTKGDTSPVGEDWGDALAGATLAEVATGLGWTDPKPPGVGRGIAVCEHHAIGGPTSSKVTLEPGGLVLVHSPAFDNGAGFYTVLRQMLSAELGIDMDRISVVPWDTKGGGGDYGVGGSRTTNGPGQFALKAGRQLLAQIREYAIERLSAPRAEVAFNGTSFSVDGQTVSLEQIAKSAPADLLVAAVEGGVDEVTHTGFAALGAEVEVDSESGQLTVRRLVGAYDSGRVLNPMLFQGQVSGATVQGLGYALMEHLQVEDGRVVTPTLADFKIPTFADLPPFEFVALEQGSFQSDGPFNMKAIGEQPLCSVAPAIANAIEDAVGVRLTDLPLTAERLHRALRAAEA